MRKSLDKPTVVSTARDLVSLGGKVFSLGFVLTGKAVGAAHTAVDKVTSYTKEGYKSQRSLPAKSESQDIDNA